jgi:hypothetical protein
MVESSLSLSNFVGSEKVLALLHLSGLISIRQALTETVLEPETHEG